MSSPALRTLAQIEKAHVLRVLLHCDGDVVKAAKILGLGQTSLYRRLQNWKLKPCGISNRIIAKRKERLAAIEEALLEAVGE